MYGEVSYDQARDILRPVISEMNIRGLEIAREFKIKFKKITFNSLIR